MNPNPLRVHESEALGICASEGFADWLTRNRLSIAFTTYQASKLVLVGTGPDDRISAYVQSIRRAMGLAVVPGALYVCGERHVHCLADALSDDAATGTHDRCLLHQVSYTTGDIDAHDLAVGADGSIYVVNTLFSCIAATSIEYSFVPIWKPHFISALCPEDRCHLNGLTLGERGPAFVTAAAASDTPFGWRAQPAGAGCVIDAASGEIAVHGLHMPHSPRLHEGDLWVLDSGSGRLGIADPRTDDFQEVAFCCGYPRGLSMLGDFAVVGISAKKGGQTTVFY
jgi:uncharacterized protein (TIGR03032 family)